MRRAVVVLVLVLGACGGGGSDSAELETAVRAYSAAFLGGDADKAVSLLSARCRDRIGAELPAVVRAAPGLYSGAEITGVDVVERSGNLARVTYRYNLPALDQISEPWVNEGGWKQDDC